MTTLIIDDLTEDILLKAILYRMQDLRRNINETRFRIKELQKQEAAMSELLAVLPKPVK